MIVRHRLAAVFVVGSVATLGLAWFLWRHHHKIAALTVIEVSPFPCPPGIPC